MGGEVPVWVSGVEKWVTGITKHTTCEEIVKALLRSSVGPRAQVADYHQYVIVESWRRVERPLDRHSRILKVWRTWGEEQSHVRLTLRRFTHPLLSSDRSKPMTSYRKHKHHNYETISKPGGAVFQLWRPANWCKHKTIHPKKLAKYKDPNVSNAKCSVQNLQKQTHGRQEVYGGKRDIEDAQDRCITLTMERLIRMILVQGETIQVQLQRMRDKDDQIKHFEQKIHELRLEELGANYMIDSYLKSEIGPIKCGVQEKPAELLNPEEIAQCVSYYETTMATVKKLEAQERAISWLTVQLAHELSDPNRDFTNCSEFQILGNALDGHITITNANHVELTENEAQLAEMDRHLPEMRKTVVRLQRELHAADSEALRLNTAWRELCNQMEDKGRGSALETEVLMLCCTGKNPADNDSNSDTGLSSLHSSADEDIFIFDTLV